jgi:arginyl-tRNA synthetase
MANDTYVQLLATLSEFDTTLMRSANERQAFILVQHMIRLSRRANSALNIGDTPLRMMNVEESRPRLLALHAARRQIADCLRLIGLVPLNRC